jgi:hypothetical protein
MVFIKSLVAVPVPCFSIPGAQIGKGLGCGLQVFPVTVLPRSDLFIARY